MQYQENHEPQMKDMDDFHKPLRKSKKRSIVIFFIALATLWALFQGVYALIF